MQIHDEAIRWDRLVSNPVYVMRVLQSRRVEEDIKRENCYQNSLKKNSCALLSFKLCLIHSHLLLLTFSPEQLAHGTTRVLLACLLHWQTQRHHPSLNSSGKSYFWPMRGNHTLRTSKSRLFSCWRETSTWRETVCPYLDIAMVEYWWPIWQSR